MAKAENIMLIDCSCSCTIIEVQYLYLEPKHESYSNMTHYNSWNKWKLHNLIITWTLIFLICRVRHIFLTPFKHSSLTSSADVIYKIADSDIASKSADTDSHLINSLMTQSWIFEFPAFLFPNFGVNNSVGGRPNALE